MYFADKPTKEEREIGVDKGFREYERRVRNILVSDDLLSKISTKISQILGGVYTVCRPVDVYNGFLYRLDFTTYCFRFGFEKTDRDTRVNYVKGDKIVGYLYIETDITDLLTNYELELPSDYIDEREPKDRIYIPDFDEVNTFINYNILRGYMTPKKIIEENIEYSEKYFIKYPFIRDDLSIVAIIDPDNDFPTILIQKKDMIKNEVINHDFWCQHVDPQTNSYYPTIPLSIRNDRKTYYDLLDERFAYVKSFTEYLSKHGSEVLRLYKSKPGERGIFGDNLPGFNVGLYNKLLHIQS